MTDHTNSAVVVTVHCDPIDVSPVGLHGTVNANVPSCVVAAPEPPDGGGLSRSVMRICTRAWSWPA